MKFFTPFCSILLTPLLVVLPIRAETPVTIGPPADVVLGPALQIQLVDSSANPAPVSTRSNGGFTVSITDSTGSPVADAVVAVRLPDSGATGSFADGTHASVAYTDQSGRAHIDRLVWGDQTGTAAVRITATKGTAHAGMLVEQEIAPAPAAAAIPAAQEPALPIATAALTLPAVPSVVSSNPSDPQLPAPRVEVQHLSTPAITPHALASASPGIAQQPSVSISNTSSVARTGGSKTKWIILAAVVAGAGAGIAMGMGHKSSSSSTSPSSALSIGTPTISIGH